MWPLPQSSTSPLVLLALVLLEVLVLVLVLLVEVLVLVLLALVDELVLVLPLPPPPVLVPPVPPPPVLAPPPPPLLEAGLLEAVLLLLLVPPFPPTASANSTGCWHPHAARVAVHRTTRPRPCERPCATIRPAYRTRSVAVSAVRRRRPCAARPRAGARADASCG
jgi:hypothetical protein